MVVFSICCICWSFALCNLLLQILTLLLGSVQRTTRTGFIKTWILVPPHIGPKMHPTNLMQAMSTHPKKVQEKPPQLPKPGDTPNPSTTTGPVCPKWSGCEVEDKCTWEVENPGRACNRPHFCTFCQKKFKQVRKHKDADCRKKAEQTGTGSDQPTS